MDETKTASLVSYDELPLWSAPFGLMLLDTIRLKPGMTVLDIGSGHGFPMLEIAERIAPRGSVTGIDPAEEAITIVGQKIVRREISNARVFRGVAEEMPFGEGEFDLIVSNNGLNNVSDQEKSFSECFRVAKPGAQMVITLNLPHTMTEFYEILEDILAKRGMMVVLDRMNEHIASKRKPVEVLKQMILQSGFTIRSINPDGFAYRFTSAEALFSHFLIRNYFLPSWKGFLPEESGSQILDKVSRRINEYCDRHREFTLSIPFACFDCIKPENR